MTGVQTCALPIYLDANDLLSGAGLSSSNTGAHLVYDTSSGKLYYDADASGAGSGVMIAQFGTVTHPTLQVTDIRPIT